MTTVKLPSTIVDIGDEAFYLCSGISDVYYADTEDKWKSIEIGDNNTNLTNAEFHYESPIPIYLSDCEINLSDDSFVYTSNAIKPRVTVKNRQKLLQPVQII